MKKVSKILVCISIIAIGIILALSSLNILDINKPFPGWWTILIIITAISYLIAYSNKTISLILLIIGVFSFIALNTEIDISIFIKLLVPSVFICVGIHFLYTYFIKSNRKEDNELGVVFKKEIVKINKKFDGGYLNSIFASLDFNLTSTAITKDIIIESTTLFGKTTIDVPNNVNVIVRSNTLFGIVRNKCKKDKKNKNTVFINVKCIFGGVDIL